MYFGNYWQNDTNGDGAADENDDKEPIKWRVLSVNDNEAFLLAEQCLDLLSYYDDYENSEDRWNWDTCALRAWLNNEFYANAFNEEEQNAIIETEVVNTDYGENTYDKIYLLSNSEITEESYGFIRDTDRIATCTDYANKSMCFDQYYLRNGYMVWSDSGTITYGDVKATVRPVLHLDLSSDQWEAIQPESTPTPTITVEGGAIAPPRTSPNNSTYTNTYTFIRNTPKPTATPVKAPSKPTIKTAKNNKKKTVTLSWKKVKNATGYQIQYATNDAFSKKSKLTKKTKLVIKKLSKKKTYSFRVRAYVLDGKTKVYSKWSKVKKVKIRK